MIPLGGILVGATLGALAARARKGTAADVALWAAVWGIIGGVVGLFLLIAVSRMMA